MVRSSFTALPGGIPVIHRDCGGIVLYAKRALRFGDVILAENFLYPDGRQPVAGEDAVFPCPKCKRTVGLSSDTVVFDCA